MPTKLERRLELLENLLIAGTAGGGAGYLGYQIGARGAVPVARAAAASPPGRVALAGVTYMALRREINERDREALEAAGASPATQEAYALAQRFSPAPTGAGFAIERVKKRKVSKANKAVKHAMGLLKAGTKASTGADKGKLPTGAFKMAVKAAGLANPGTRTVIGKGKGRVKALARKIRKWW